MNALDAIAKESYKPGEFIFFEGDVENHFYIVETGVVQIFTKDKANNRVNIVQIFDGESFGEFAMLDQKPRSATAQAISDVTLVRVSADAFQQLMDELPGWANSMMRSFVDRLKNMTELLKDSDQFLKRK
jgi:CRP/FNR family cyclic AMP-dependent transcriptional regulator